MWCTLKSGIFSLLVFSFSIVLLASKQTLMKNPFFTSNSFYLLDFVTCEQRMYKHSGYSGAFCRHKKFKSYPLKHEKMQSSFANLNKAGGDCSSHLSQDQVVFTLISFKTCI